MEIYRIRTHEEIKKKLSRRKKRQKEKQQKSESKNQDLDGAMEIDGEEHPIRAEDLITSYQIIRTDGKIRSFDFSTIGDNYKASSIQVRIFPNILFITISFQCN